MAQAQFWIIPIAILGACVGSFLNVVIYRLPLGLSVAQPRWSFCPRCEHRIRPIDNMPILGWLRLGGRCRDCGLPIAPIYPLVECITLLLFVAVWDAVFIADVIAPTGIARTPGGLWPLAVANLFLFSGLVATAVMDLETYTVDIRICTLTVGVAAAVFGLWPAVAQIPAGVATGQADPLPPVVVAAAIAAGAAWAATALIRHFVLGQSASAMPPDEPAGAPAGAVEAGADPDSVIPPPPAETSAPSIGPVVALVVVVMATVYWVAGAPGWSPVKFLAAGQARGIGYLFVFCLMLLIAAHIPREADEQIIEEIESQKHESRGLAIRELATFIPAILAIVAVAWMAVRGKWVATDWKDERWGSVSPVLVQCAAFAGHSLASAILAAALGWAVRILGTLGFGKEAFGTGDIYILAAIGAVGGFWLTLIGFFLAAFLALLGVILTLFHRRPRAIPFGPWLALGAFLGLYVRVPLTSLFGPALSFFWGRFTGTITG